MGIKNSQGEYIYFIDSDDFISENGLKKLYEKAVENNSDLTFCGFNRISDQNELIMKYENYFNYLNKNEQKNGLKILSDFLMNKIWICTGSAIYKKNIIKEHKIFYNQEYSSGEDQHFLMNFLYYSKNISSVNEVLFYYVIHNKGLSTSLNVFDSIIVFKDFCEFLKKEVDINKELKENILSIVSIIKKYKIPYLEIRGYYRIAKMLSWNEYKKLLKKRNLNNKKIKIYKINKYSIFSFFGMILLKYFPKLFYKISNKLKK
ncbi:glycosyltransferase [Oceanotoga sp. DSM 15011]|nr:glycosyltransferase [Oceanotoga sp. DSM 15011]UYP01436.1 glycosyltransferase [Oceanotoga sp. DSM 15011]